MFKSKKKLCVLSLNENNMYNIKATFIERSDMQLGYKTVRLFIRC